MRHFGGKHDTLNFVTQQKPKWDGTKSKVVVSRVAPLTLHLIVQYMQKPQIIRDNNVSICVIHI